MIGDRDNTVVVYDLRSDVRNFSTLVWSYEEASGFSQLIEVLDALNLQASEYSRFLDGRINQLKKPVFRSELLQDDFLFRIPGYRAGIFATQQFTDRVESCGLTGFEFVQVDPQPDDSADRQRFLQRHKRRQR